MGTYEVMLLKFVAKEVIKRMAARRGVHGVTNEDIDKLAKDPLSLLAVLEDDGKLRNEVMDGIADTVDVIAGNAIDPLVDVLKRLLGGKGSDES